MNRLESTEKQLDTEQKKIRLSILSACMKVENREQGYLTYLEQVNELGKELEQLSQGKFKLNSNVNIARGKLCDYFCSLEIVEYLSHNKIDFYTFEELMDFAKQFELDESTLLVVRDLYKNLSTLKKIEDDKICIMESCLANFLGINLISQYNYRCIVSEKNSILKAEYKSGDQLQIDYMKALKMIEERKSFLDPRLTKIAKRMLEELFDYYKSGNKELILGFQKQIGV